MKHLLEEKFLPYVNKPGQYTGGELGSIIKSDENLFRIALGYPDLYEIGMSYLGLQILYNIINKDNQLACERFFVPGVDAEEILRREKIPVFTLETFRPLNKCNVIGFTLAYEMLFTNLLNILDISGIPLASEDRSDNDPIIIAGGPVVHNPEPCSRFIDAFYIGDGETNIIPLLNSLAQSRHRPRLERLKNLVREIPSIYIPRLYDSRTLRPNFDFVPEKIKSYKLDKLESEFYPEQPVVPFVETVHDRLTVEIMRGCPRGCRFCQAGEIYKPVRMRTKDEIIRQTEKQIKATGFDEVSLLSLSSSDYPDIIPLTIQLNGILESRKTALSLPSLRPGTFSQELAEAVKSTRKTGLTFAPEAGTERLRTLIRKDVTDRDLFETLELLFNNGWNLVKLYFMIGLPTETDDDIKGLVSLIHQAATIARKCKGNNFINITISPFSPKAQTPFQWDEQPSPESIRQKNEFIIRSFRSSMINIKLRDPHLSFLEGVLGRAGREAGSVIESAFRLGARFDGWTEHFKYDLWMKAFADNHIDPNEYLKGKSFSSVLPWAHIETYRSTEFLMKERNRTSVMLRDARKQEAPESPVKPEENESVGFGRSPRKMVKTSLASPIQSCIRVKWGRSGLTRFLSHLDNIRVIERAIRRSEIPIEYSQGYHPHMKLSFGPPLQLGYESEAEYFDMTLSRPFQPHMFQFLLRAMPWGYNIFDSGVVINQKISLSGKLNRAVYDIGRISFDDYQNKIEPLRECSEIIIKRDSKTGAKDVDIRPAIYNFDWVQRSETDSVLRMELGVGTAGYARPSEILLAAGVTEEKDIPALKIVRCNLLYVDADGQKFTPMEFL